MSIRVIDQATGERFSVVGIEADLVRWLCAKRRLRGVPAGRLMVNWGQGGGIKIEVTNAERIGPTPKEGGDA